MFNNFEEKYKDTFILETNMDPVDCPWVREKNYLLL